VQSPFTEYDPQISPDGKWLAYGSNETGRFEVYVQPFPAGGARWQVTSDGGDMPRWSKDGRELFYCNFDRPARGLMAALVLPGADFRTDKPRLLFHGSFDNGEYEVARDGRFLMLKGIEQETAPTQIHLVLNWFEELSHK
jgi:eukaryotic-like serine/threonine-protein kinase